MQKELPNEKNKFKSLADKKRKLRIEKLEKTKNKKLSSTQKLFLVCGIPVFGAVIILLLLLSKQAVFDYKIFFNLLLKVFLFGLCATSIYFRIKFRQKLRFCFKIFVWVMFFCSLYFLALLIIPMSALNQVFAFYNTLKNDIIETINKIFQ